MTIPVECPHCEERFQLSPDLVGKATRCPGCREVFTVEPVAGYVPPPAELPYERVESNDFAPQPVRESAAPVAPPADVPTLQPLADVPTLQPLSTVPTLRPLDVPVAPPLQVARQLPAATALPGPREVAWSGEDAPAAPPVLSPVATLDDEERAFIRRRRTQRPWQKVILALLVVGILGTAVVGGVGYFLNRARAEETLAAEADKDYKDANYPVAHEKFKKLVAEFDASDARDKYRFFAALSEMRAAVGSVTSRENPEPARRSFEAFLKEFGETPLAQPETGYGLDIVTAGRQLCDTFADHAGDRHKKYREDLRAYQTNLGELDAGERSVAAGRKVVPDAEKYRDKSAGSGLDAQRKKFDELDATFAAERKRLGVLAPYRDLPAAPSSARIEEFVGVLKENQLAADAEGQKMIADAEATLRGRIEPVTRMARPLPFPSGVPAPVLFASSPVGGPAPRPDPDAATDVVFAVARGVLYALDAHFGELLWGVRVAAPTADPRGVDLPVRVAVGAADLVLVAADAGGKPALTARDARSGDPVWHQPLPAPPVGRPVVVGGRVYLPLRDADGTVAEFEVTSGVRSRDLVVRQPLAGGLTVLPGARPGVFYLFVPGDMKRTFVFEVGRESDAGEQLPPRCVRVLLTEHPRDGLRGDPLLVTPADADGPRFLILAQTDGPQAMKLRAFPLPAPEDLAPKGDGPPEESAPRAHEVSAPGWAWFPGLTDGERVVLATDAGAFLAFGVNQLGNDDRPLFALPTPKPVGEQEAVTRSQVVAVEEDSYWAVLSGQLVRLRTAVDPAGGLRIIPQGVGRAVGEPVNRPQVRAASNLGVVVARPGGSSNVQAVAFDLVTGQVRWQRRLGVTPAGPPVAGGGPVVVADEDGGVYAVAPDKPEAPAAVVAPPFVDLAGRATVAATADGKTAWVLAVEADAKGRRLRVRKVAGGVLAADATVELPDQPAGAPVALGEAFLVPLANGYVYRYAAGDARLSAGPLWRGGDAGDAVCFLTPLSATEFLATDGGRKFLRWRWPAGADAKAEKVAGPWEAKAKFAVPVAAVGAQFAAAEAGGLVLLFDASQPGEPVRRWGPGEKSGVPAGKPTDRLAVVTAGGKDVLVYTIDRRHVVALDPTKDAAAWSVLVAADAGELLGWVADGGRVVATSLGGRVSVLDAATGQPVTTAAPPTGPVAASAAVPVAAGRGLVILSDGTAAVVPLTPAKE